MSRVFSQPILIFIIFLVFSHLNLSAGIYSYEFKKVMFNSHTATAQLGDLEWTINPGKVPMKDIYFGFSSNMGQRIETKLKKHTLNPLTLSTKDLTREITSITITTHLTVHGNLGVTVGNTPFKCQNHAKVTVGTKTGSYTFTGLGQGEICINWYQSRYCAIFIKSIIIEYVGDDGKQNQILSFPKKSYETFIDENFIAPKVSGNQTEVSYSSSNTNVATVDKQNGEVTLKGIGSTIITANASETETHNSADASYTLNVKPTDVHTTTFDFTHIENFGLSNPNSTWYITISSIFSKDIILTANKYNNFHKSTSGVVRFKLNSNGVMTLNAPRGMKIQSIIFKGENLDKLTADGKPVADGIWKGNDTNVTFKASKVVAFSSAQITYHGQYELPISAVNYATFSAPQAYIMPLGLEGGVVTIRENIANVKFCYLPGDIVPANEPLVIKGETNTYKLKPISNTEAVKKENILHSAFTNDTIRAKEGHVIFIFSRNIDQQLGFYYQKGSENGDFVTGIVNKAYIEIPKSLLQNTHGFRMNILPTGISPIPNIGMNKKNRLYNIDGRRAQTPPHALSKGIYIINGKKYLSN